MISRLLGLKLIRDFWQRLGMLVALVLIIGVGIGNYISMAAVYRDLGQARDHYYKRYHLADFTLHLKRAPQTVVKTLEHVPNVLRLRTRIRVAAITTLPQKSYSGVVKPIPGEVLSLPASRDSLINDIFLYRGRWFTNEWSDEVIIDEQFAHARHLHPGDRLRVILPDREHDLLIVGTAFSPEFVMILSPGSILSPEPANYAVMYLPKRILEHSADLNDSFNQLLGMTRDRSPIALKNTMHLLSSKLDPYGVQFQTAQHEQVSVKILHDEIEHLKSVMVIFPAIFLIVALLVFNAVMSRLVIQQRGLIGILKAVGYSNKIISIHYLCYGVFVGILGWIVGLVVGLALQYLSIVMYQTYFSIPGMQVHLYPQVFWQGLGIGVFSAVLGTFYGIHLAIKMQPAEAMRPALPEQGRCLFIDRFSRFWKTLSFQNKMVMRAITRNRFRSIIAIVASMLATAIVFCSLSMLDSMNEMVYFSFDLIQHQDYTLTLREPLGRTIMSTLKHLPGVFNVEPQLTIPVELQNGSFMKRLEVTGLPFKNRLFTPVDQQRQIIEIPRDGIVLTQTLAEILHVSKGSKLILKPLVGERKPLTVSVTQVVPSYLGFSVYAHQVWLSRLLGNTWLANRILFEMQPQVDRAPFLKATHSLASMVNITDTQEAHDVLIETLNRFMAFSLFLMIAFAGTIAMGTIVNMAMISLSERERDVASLRVLGLTHFQVSQIFFTESALLNIVGISLGLGLGIYFTYGLVHAFSTEIFSMPFVIRSLRLVETGFIMCCFVIISQMIVYRMIKRLNWFDVLNNRE